MCADLFDAEPGSDCDACWDGFFVVVVGGGGHVDDDEEGFDGEGDVSCSVGDLSCVLEVEWVLGVEDEGVGE